jgi:hypothetical protein
MGRTGPKAPGKGPAFSEMEMFDVFSRGNYVESVRTRRELENLAEDLLARLGPEGFGKKRLTAIRSIHFLPKLSGGPEFSGTLSKTLTPKGHP